MKNFYLNKMIWYVNIVIFVISLSLVSHTLAQTGGDYELTWSTIDGGGGISSGGPYELLVTIGQPDAAAVSGGDYELLGGFLTGGPLCFVDFHHFARFAEHWLDEHCNEENNWCGGADLFEDEYNIVDGLDLQFFVEQWLCCCPVDWPLK
jgi:hypothetical protein